MNAHFPKLRTHLIWNYVSFAFMAFTGLVMNVFIGAVYGAEGLGIFNLVFALYVIASQLATMGLHYSALKHIAENDRPELQSVIVHSAILSGFCVSLVCAGILFGLHGYAGQIFKSPDIGQSLLYVLPGLVFITFNKIMLWVLNGQRRMILYSIGQIIRSAGLLLSLSALIYLKVPAFKLTLIFSLADGFLVLFCGFFLIKEHGFKNPHLSWPWIKNHTVFGSKALWGGILIESNLKVDVLMLGLLTTPMTVGIYSFAATLAEGIYNLLFVIRALINPVLVKLLKEKDFNSIHTVLVKTAFYVYPALVLIWLVSAALYTPILNILALESFLPAFMPLLVLLGGILLVGPFIPFIEILMQAGKSGRYSQLMTMIICTNIVLNFVFIQWIGMTGAAIATALHLILSVFYLKIMCKMHLDLDLKLIWIDLWKDRTSHD